MIKKFSYLLFVFIGLFFLNLHVKADFNVTGKTSGLPSCSSSTFPTFLEEDTYYPCIFNWSLNYGLNEVNNPSANPSLNSSTTIDDFPYIVSVSYVSPNSSSHFDYDILFFKSEPELITYNGNKVLQSNGGYFWYRRYWYNNSSRRASLYYVDPLTASLNQPIRYGLNNFSNNSTYDRIYNTSNFSFDNISTLSNFPQNNYFILPFSWGDIYFNYFYLDDVLVGQNSCSTATLNLSHVGWPCEFSSSDSITANKVVSIIHLDTTYFPSEYWYNLLNWSNTDNRYYNGLFGGNFPQNTNLTSFAFYNIPTSSIIHNINVLDVQSSFIVRPNSNLTYSLFSLAFNTNDTILTGYDSLRVVVEFPETSFNDFSIWNEGFNNLSENYIQENINIASNEIQKEILNDLNGNTVSVDNYTLFFTDFSLNDHGLSSFITLPLSFLQNMSSSSCNSVSFPIPKTNQNIVLPCLSSFYNQYIQPIYVLITLVIRFFIYYRVGLDCFNFIKKLHSPDNSKVEVIDL